MSIIDCQLRDVVELAYGKSLPERNRKEGAVPVYGSGGIGGYHSVPLVEGPGVIVGRKGTVGSVYFEKNDFFPIDTVYFVRPFIEKISLEYSYYLLKNLPLASLNSDAAVPGLNRDRAYSLPIRLPSLDQQSRIVEFLRQYDDLIENNRRRIQLLEESARLLYQEWFVHLRFPGHEQVKITDGVPEGWSIKRVDSLLGKVAKKKKIKKEEYLEDGVVPCVDQSQEFIGGYIDDEEAAITENLPVVVFGDHTRIVKFIDFPFAPGADGTQLLVPNDEEIPRDFFYFMISSINVANAFYARHFKFLKAKDVLVPEKKLMHEFSLVVKDNMLQIKLLRNQNRSLAKARDLLLPKLMSGELAV